VRAVALAAALALAAAAAAARAEAPAAEDPPACREALAALPEQSALEALARAEQAAAAQANAARAEARKLLRKQVGGGERGGLAASDAAEPLLARAAELRRHGKQLCHCRQRRGDPNRQDCEFLYPETLK
jgi:hypothetical protein